MEYEVSEKIKRTFDTLMSMPEVRKALRFIEDDAEHSIEEQKRLTLIEAPTFHEDERSAAYADYMRDLSLSDVHVDD